MGKGQMILVVDDMAEQRNLAKNTQQLLGYKVELACSGEDAVVKCRGTEFDLIILDMIMPGGMDGLATYEKINTIKVGQKAVIASGFSDTVSFRTAREIGAGMYLKKPYTVASLAKALHHELAAS